MTLTFQNVRKALDIDWNEFVAGTLFVAGRRPALVFFFLCWMLFGSYNMCIYVWVCRCVYICVYILYVYMYVCG